jgi:hypothetical protein
LTATALGSHWNPANAVYGSLAGQGSAPVDFTQCDLTNGVHSAFHTINDQDIAPTHITPNGTHACSTIDVGVGDDNFGSGSFGFMHCHSHVGANCDIAHAHMDLSNPSIPEDPFRTLKTVCHEVGHTLGLEHRASIANSCMWAGLELNNQMHFDSHDVNVINSHY